MAVLFCTNGLGTVSMEFKETNILIPLIKSVLGYSDENKYLIIQLAAEEAQDSLLPREKEIFEYLLQNYKDHNQFPTEPIFLTKFTEYNNVNVWKEAKVYEDDASLDYHRKQFVTYRKRQSLSNLLIKYANDVRSKGLSSDDLENLRTYADTTDESVDPMAIPDVMELYKEDKHRDAGIKTYIPELDNIIGGIKQGTIATLAGASGHGKTTWAVNMAYKAARDGKRVVYISLEVPYRDLLYDLISLHSNDNKFNNIRLEHNKIRKGQLSDMEEEHMKKVCADLQANILPNLVILTERNFKDFSYGEVRDMLYKIDDVREIYGIFVDHANLLKFQSKAKFSNVGDSINEYISFFRKMAICFRIDKNGKDRQIVVVLLCQINRTGLSKASDTTKRDPNLEGKYDINALAEANELERASSYVFTCYSSDAQKIAHEARCQLLKNRFGQQQINPLTISFDPAHYLYGELYDEETSSTHTETTSSFDDFLGIDPNSIGLGSTDTFDLLC